jgi:hypothetical protein
MKKLLFIAAAFAMTNAFAQDDGCPTVYADPYADCRKGITFLNATPGFDTYSWTPAGPLSNPNIANPFTSTPGAYTVTATMLVGADLVVNGDFSGGNNWFTSGQTYSSVYSPCNYFVGPGWFSSTLDPNFPDHTATADNMFMSVDGCSPATILWEQTMSVAGATNYTFSFWGSRADQVQPIYEIHFIGDVTGDVIVSTQNGVPYTGTWAWDQHSVSCWNSGLNSTVTIRVVNLETNSYGNDFGMDDFSFRQCCTSSYTVFAPAMNGMNLFTNGDFSLGNSWFTSGHNYSSVYTPCNYFVGPGWFSSTLDPNFPDNTPTSDNMFMSIDGCAPATILWEQTIPVQMLTVYQFAFWATRADAVQPIYEIHFIGDVTGDVIVGTQNGIPYTGTWTWDQYGIPCWFSDDNSTLTVRIINLETNSYGNDFGMDDFSFRECCYPDECCRQGDPDGRMAKPAENSIDVFPNPGNGSFQVTLAEPVVNAQAELVNVLGESVDAFTFSGKTYNYSPAHALAPGVYMLRVTDGGVQYSRQVVVE